ncbi:MAG: hypothetical protein Q9221_005928 [Calogaya cf. arnoldii]
MGEYLVNSIPTDPVKYQEWLQSQRAFYAKWDDLLKTFLCITQAQFQDVESRFHEIETHETDPLLDEAFSYRLSAFPNHRFTHHGYWTEYHYTIDLDYEAFSIGTGAHYRLDCIPRDRQWIKALLSDGTGEYYVHPGLAPEASLASLAVEPQHSKTVISTALTKKQVTPNLPGPLNVLAKFQLQLFNIFQQQELNDLPESVLSWNAEDLAFRELSFHILCLAVGGDYLTVVDNHRTVNPKYWRDYYSALIHGNDPDGERELLTPLGLGYHMDDRPLGTAPYSSKYWLEGILVCLVPRLDQPNIAPNAMAEAVHYGRDVCERSSFNAVLISIFDIVLIKCFPNGTVDHSAVMPLVRVRDCSGLDPRQRFSDTWLDAALERHRQSPREPNEYPEVNFDNRFPLNLVPDEDVEATFLRLVNFFDSTAVTALFSAKSSTCSIPPEVITIILGQVTDTRTFIACTKVSRTFRDLCKQRPLIMDDVLATVPLDLGTDVDFRALVLSSGQQMDITFKAYRYRGKDVYRYLTGSEFNRKTVSLGFSIKGLELQVPFKTPLQRPRRNYEIDKSALIPDESLWGKAAVHEKLKANNDIRTLEDFWKQVTSSVAGGDIWGQNFGCRIKCGFTLPYNTCHHFMKTSKFSNYDDHGYYLMLMIKRGSRYWDCLWDDIIREAKEELVKVDDDVFEEIKIPVGEHGWYRTKRVPIPVGAGDLPVILTVGLEVRLFEWRQTEPDSDASKQGHFDGTLTEINPGIIYSIMDAYDRVVIEAVLRAAVKRMQDAPKRDGWTAPTSALTDKGARQTRNLMIGQ